MHLHHLLAEEGERGEGHVLEGRGVADELRRGPAVLHLPQDVGQEEEDGDQPAQPDPRLAEMPALRREQQAHEHPEAEEEKAVLVLQPEPADEPEEEPELRVAGVHDPHHDPGPQRPEQDVERVHGEDVEEEEIDRDDQGADRGQCLGVAAAAHLAGDPAG